MGERSEREEKLKRYASGKNRQKIFPLIISRPNG